MPWKLSEYISFARKSVRCNGKRRTLNLLTVVADALRALELYSSKPSVQYQCGAAMLVEHVGGDVVRVLGLAGTPSRDTATETD
jgi:hypothetical protein